MFIDTISNPLASSRGAKYSEVTKRVHQQRFAPPELSNCLNSEAINISSPPGRNPHTKLCQNKKRNVVSQRAVGTEIIAI